MSYNASSGLPRMLSGYFIDGWSTARSRQLIRTAPVYIGHYYASTFHKRIMSVYVNERGGDKNIILASFPNGLMIYRRDELWNRCSARAHNMIHRWVLQNSDNLHKDFLLDGESYDVRKIKVPVFNILTTQQINRHTNGSFNDHMAATLQTSEE